MVLHMHCDCQSRVCYCAVDVVLKVLLDAKLRFAHMHDEAIVVEVMMVECCSIYVCCVVLTFEIFSSWM